MFHAEHPNHHQDQYHEENDLDRQWKPLIGGLV